MIGVITLPNFMFYNYGGVLQNYALTMYLRKLGYDVMPIHCNSTTLQGAIRESIYDLFGLRIMKKKGEIKFELIDSNAKARNKKFEEFIKTHIKPTNFNYYTDKVFAQINDQCDCVIIGSDQVWNPSFIKNMLFTYTLGFLPPEKRISYAASFGISEIPSNMRDGYIQNLKDFKAISVREDMAAELISGLINSTPPVLVDPTLLLNREQWHMVAEKHPNRNSKPYLLTYFLGEESEHIKSTIQSFAKRNNLDIYKLSDTSDIRFYSAGPSEFLDLFENASFVCTDSFHATVFSIIFEKPFSVFPRKQAGMDKMSSRIETLLNKFQIESIDLDFIKDSKFNFDQNRNVEDKMEIERKKSKEFLETYCSIK